MTDFFNGIGRFLPVAIVSLGRFLSVGVTKVLAKSNAITGQIERRFERLTQTLGVDVVGLFKPSSAD
ncbi:hypothetical protein NVV94_24280 [Pseudomonas sp. LS1212]|uniref:hypothetical protein n=1 Tax=Pseudomonas sp. LS1212 TaxID=2972478 RepID=UPI00215D532A|nr:hypothetical protein [Pseudomonas sp. LS1212]UVJ43621.1 hypothetical protein NVV94_24280 [Pseudomonas sp. LS1212]